MKRMKYPHSMLDYEHVSHTEMMISGKADSKREYCISVVVHLNDGYSFTVIERFIKKKLINAMVDCLMTKEATSSFYENPEECPFPINDENDRFVSSDIVSFDTLLHDVKKNKIIDVE